MTVIEDDIQGDYERCRRIPTKEGNALCNNARNILSGGSRKSFFCSFFFLFPFFFFFFWGGGGGDGEPNICGRQPRTFSKGTLGSLL